MKKTTKSSMENLALISQVGIMMIVPIGFGVFAGNFLDNKFGTTPLWLIVMIILGVGSSFRNLMKLATTKSKEYKNDYTARTQVENYAKEKQKNLTFKDVQSDEEHKLENQFSEVQKSKNTEQEMNLKAMKAEEIKADEAEIEKMKE